MIFLPLNALPQDKIARSKLLHEYFVGQCVTSTLTNDVWAVDLHYPDFPDYYIDPRLREGLDWWQSELRVSEIPFAVKQDQGFQLSLNDSWTLLAWSQWLSKAYVDKGQLPSEIIILHVDDHDDLMSPRVWSEASKWHDAITRESVNLIEPESVIQAIRSGAIGIGSFIVPLLHFLQKVEIRHLCATNYSVVRQGYYSLTPTLTPDHLLNLDSKRLAVELQACGERTLREHTKSIYKVTANLNEWLKDLKPDVPILLHIDMDYFNNRFNGDSDWETHSSRYDPPYEEVITLVDGIFTALHLNGVMNRICNIAVALSPAFFPVEFWEPSIERIRYHLSEQQFQ